MTGAVDDVMRTFISYLSVTLIIYRINVVFVSIDGLGDFCKMELNKLYYFLGDLTLDSKWTLMNCDGFILGDMTVREMKESDYWDEYVRYISVAAKSIYLVI